MSNDLITWLRAQIDEDERIAREASGDPWVTGRSKGYEYSRPGDVYAIAYDGTPARIAQGTGCGPDISAEQSSEHIARHDPARVLADVAAKRQILELHDHAAKGAMWCQHWDANAFDDRGEQGAWVTEEPLCQTVRLVALPYADRPGYQPVWAPPE
jgi:hypothetical protein